MKLGFDSGHVSLQRCSVECRKAKRTSMRGILISRGGIDVERGMWSVGGSVPTLHLHVMHVCWLRLIW